MMEFQAIIEITLPPAPVQVITQVGRQVTIAGVTGELNGNFDVVVESTAPLKIRAGLNSAVTISVVEVLANGKQSNPATLTFSPVDYIEAVSADSNAFKIKVLSVEEVQVADLNVAADSAAATPDISP